MGLTPQEKSDRRRFFATALSNSDATDEDLLKLCAESKGEGGNSQATLSFAIFEGGGLEIILIAAQKGAPMFADLLPTKYPRYQNFQIRIIPESYASPGLHAEMMIMRNLMLHGIIDPSNIQESAKAIKLRIVCPGKLVCPDCSGWLRKHGIPHYPVDCGDTSPNWVNPRTGACYRVTQKGISYYHKKADPLLEKDEVVVGAPIGTGNVRPLNPIHW